MGTDTKLADLPDDIELLVGNSVTEMPRVSVVIPAYNAVDLIPETIDSIKTQTFTDLEIIVINDGSPETAELETKLKPYFADIVYIKQPGRGAGSARNAGISIARGEFIAFIDSDDLWLPEFLSSQIAFLEKNEFDMVYSDAFLFGSHIVGAPRFMDTAPSKGEVTAESLLAYECNIITSGVVARRSMIIAAGAFEEQRARAHDFHLWVRMAKIGCRIGYQQIPLVRYRVHLDSLSGDSISRVEREINVMNRLKNSVKFTDREFAIIERQLVDLDAGRLVEVGKSQLLKGQYTDAYNSFATANKTKRSIKLTIVSFLAQFAPKFLEKHYRARRSEDIAMIR